MVRKMLILGCAALSLMAVSCAAPASGTKVARVEADAAMDLSGRWNDTDSRLVADEMIKDALNQRWIFKWENEQKVPTVIVGRVTNRSHEHISVQAFVKDIERALINSGRVEFVASREEREGIRDEREDQQVHASVQTRSDMGEESGADLMMIGNINTIVDQEGKRSVIYYQINMELIELESTKKVWIGEKKIKKYVERATAKF